MQQSNLAQLQAMKCKFYEPKFNKKNTGFQN